MGPLHLLLLALGLQQPGPRNLGPRPQLDTRLDTIADNAPHLGHRLGRQTTCSPDKRTRYKMVQKGAEVQARRGLKFTCPPDSTIMSCRCPKTLNNGTKVNKNVEVPHDNPRTCSCRDVTCGTDCKKIVTRAICCGDFKRCPINKSQKPSHRTDWVCRVDVRRTFNLKPAAVSIASLNSALEIAMEYLRRHPREQVELFLRRGTYNIDSGEKPAMLLKHFRPEANGRLIIAGQGMDETTLRFNDWRGHMLSANNVSKVTIRDLHLTRSSPGATQGFVRQVTAGMVVLEIPPGFPNPAQIHNGHEDESTRAYLRKFTNISSPQMVLDGNAQVRWMSTYQVFQNNDRLWAFKLRQPNIVVPAYQYGDLIGIKSKCCGEPRSISYFFRESREVMFERVRWTRQSRGVFRLGTQDVTIKDCEIVRERPVGGMGWCLSTSDGGPQFGQPKDPYMHKVKVENFYAENTGDDSLAFFNAKTEAVVENSVIKDSFARSILLYKSPDVQYSNVHLERAPVCTNNNLNDIRKIYDFDEYASRTFEFLWNLIVAPTPAPAPATAPSATRNKYDPNQLLGSDCTLSV